MDCETARLFLHFHRPGDRDLDGPEADELHAHLEQCSQCNALALASSHLDQHLGRAMRAVEMPGGLKARLLERLAADRRTVRRRRIGRVARVLALAACLLLVVWFGYAYYFSNQPARTVYPDEVLYSVNVAPFAQERVEEAIKDLDDPPGKQLVGSPLKGQGGRQGAPNFVNYNLLLGVPSLADLPGHPRGKYRVPQLIFASGSKWAVVFILDNRRFSVGELENSTHGYPRQLAIERRDGFAYLILHNGSQTNSWEDWLKTTTDVE
jgi:hypothetical protein